MSVLGLPVVAIASSQVPMPTPDRPSPLSCAPQSIGSFLSAGSRAAQYKHPDVPAYVAVAVAVHVAGAGVVAHDLHNDGAHVGAVGIEHGSAAVAARAGKIYRASSNGGTAAP